MTFNEYIKFLEGKGIYLNDDRVIFKKHDRYETCLSNILFSKIKECFFKISDACSEFVVNVQNIYYRIIVFK